MGSWTERGFYRVASADMSVAGESTDYLSYESRLQAMLTVEAALASALARSGIISDDQAIAIAKACRVDSYDAEALERLGAKAGTPVIPLVEELVAKVHSISESTSRFVHYGATSQDILDTATMLQLKNIVPQISEYLSRIEAEFFSRAKENANTPVLGLSLIHI